METRLSFRLKTLRKSFSYTPAQVVKKLKKNNLNYSEQSVYKWEQGKVIPSVETLYALSSIYNCNISYLLEENAYNYVKVNTNDIKVLRIFRTNFLFRSILTLIIRLLNQNSN